jgi:hypothetical protein
MITIYDRNGDPLKVHEVDARIHLASGNFFKEPPVIEKEEVFKTEKREDAPAIDRLELSTEEKEKNLESETNANPESRAAAIEPALGHKRKVKPPAVGMD